MPTPRPLPPVEPSELSRRLIRPLTAREVRVAMLVGEGMNHTQLQAALGLAPNSVLGHVMNVADKIGESGEAPMELRGIDRVRYWIMRHQAQTLYERLEATQRELAKANGTSEARDAVRHSEGQRRPA